MRTSVFITALMLVPSLRAAAPVVADDGYGELVLVPASAFRMGDNFGDGE